MEVRLITDFDATKPLAGDWNCMGRGVPFRRWEWLASWWRHYRQDRRLYVLAVLHEGHPVAIAPWYMESSATRGRVLRMLGDGEACSDYLGVLSTPEWSDTATEVLAQWLTEGAAEPAAEHLGGERFGADWDLLELCGVAATEPTTASLVAHLHERGNRVHREEGPNCWQIALPGDWESFLASLSKSHRKQIRRADQRSLESAAVKHRVITAHDERFPSAWQSLIDLHQLRRRSLGEPGCFASTAFSGFLREAVEAMLPAGVVELHLLETGDGPLAAELHLLGDDVVYAYQAGIDPAAVADEPGRLMNIAVIRRAIALQRKGFDFLRGDEPYKPHWRAEPRRLVDIRVVPRKTSAQWRHGMWLAGGTFKNLVKSGMQLTGMK